MPGPNPFPIMVTYTIAELVSLAEVPPATIHYYLRQGLLPKPRQAAPNRFLYDERHVRGLRLIRSLREQRGLALPMIRRILPELLALEKEEAFLPELWDRALAPRMQQRRLPAGRLLEAAKRAFARSGFAEVNIDDLTRAARIAKGSFYRHFGSKEELFLAAAESLARDAAASFRERVGDEGIAPAAAGAMLAQVIAPALPVFAELLSRWLQDRAGYGPAARQVFVGILERVGEPITGPGGPEERAARAVGEAVASLLASLATAPPVSNVIPMGPG